MDLTLKDGRVVSLDDSMSAYEAAKRIGDGLAKSALACKINGVVCSMDTLVDKDCDFELLTFQDEEGRRVYRHTCAHILAQAVKNVYPTVQLAIGPAVDNGFYYDFDFRTPITQADFGKIESEMKSIVKANLPIIRIECTRKEAEGRIAKMKQIYKAELLSDIPQNQKITFYQQGDFVDLCAGPHLTSTGKIKAFKLTSLTGAYWKGNEKTRCSRVFTARVSRKNPILTSISKSSKTQKCATTTKLAESLACL